MCHRPWSGLIISLLETGSLHARDCRWQHQVELNRSYSQCTDGRNSTNQNIRGNSENLFVSKELAVIDQILNHDADHGICSDCRFKWRWWYPHWSKCNSHNVAWVMPGHHTKRSNVVCQCNIVCVGSDLQITLGGDQTIEGGEQTSEALERSGGADCSVWGTAKGMALGIPRQSNGAILTWIRCVAGGDSVRNRHNVRPSSTTHCSSRSQAVESVSNKIPKGSAMGETSIWSTVFWWNQGLLRFLSAEQGDYL